MTKTLLLISALLAPPVLSAASPEDLPGATVTIPNTELRALWEAAHPKETPKKVLPIPCALHQAIYVIYVGAGTLQASFQAKNFSSKWQFLPLVSSSLRPFPQRILMGRVTPNWCSAINASACFFPQPRASRSARHSTPLPCTKRSAASVSKRCNRRFAALVGPVHRLLWGHPPARQIVAHRPHAHILTPVFSED